MLSKYIRPILFFLAMNLMLAACSENGDSLDESEDRNIVQQTETSAPVKKQIRVLDMPIITQEQMEPIRAWAETEFNDKYGAQLPDLNGRPISIAVFNEISGFFNFSDRYENDNCIDWLERLLTIEPKQIVKLSSSDYKQKMPKDSIEEVWREVDEKVEKTLDDVCADESADNPEFSYQTQLSRLYIDKVKEITIETRISAENLRSERQIAAEKEYYKDRGLPVPNKRLDSDWPETLDINDDEMKVFKEWVDRAFESEQISTLRNANEQSMFIDLYSSISGNWEFIYDYYSDEEFRGYRRCVTGIRELLLRVPADTVEIAQHKLQNDQDSADFTQEYLDSFVKSRADYCVDAVKTNDALAYHDKLARLYIDRIAEFTNDSFKNAENLRPAKLEQERVSEEKRIAQNRQHIQSMEERPKTVQELQAETRNIVAQRQLEIGRHFAEKQSVKTETQPAKPDQGPGTLTISSCNEAIDKYDAKDASSKFFPKFLPAVADQHFYSLRASRIEYQEAGFVVLSLGGQVPAMFMKTPKTVENFEGNSTGLYCGVGKWVDVTSGSMGRVPVVEAVFIGNN